MGKKTIQDRIDNIQRAMDQQPATVQLLDSTKHIFYISKKAEGEELFEKVCAFIGLVEKDYFGLSFGDSDENQQWIYDDKRIAKQLKGHPWNFNFKVKFYPPEPATLAEDKTRHLLTLQIRQDISTGKLPATLATHALLGSYVAQSVRGDYEPSLDYVDFLRSCYLSPSPTETLYEKVEELHKHHKGETSVEADLHYLENAKKLSMYGVQLFHAKDGKGTPVQIGISAHGINVYLDQIRVHRFLWQNIIKIGYQRNIFVVKVKPGELEKNESTVAFKMSDYEAAKRVWKCGVEHHTFFRLIQPEEKPYRGLFRWSSAKFRYQGRTYFQAKMASQMFCKSQPIQRSQSVRVAENDGKVAIPASLSQTLPLKYSDNGVDRKLGWNDRIISPEKISTKVMEAVRDKDERKPDVIEVGITSNTSGKLLDNVHSPVTFTNSVTTATTDAAGIITAIAPTTTSVTDTAFTTVTGTTTVTATTDTTATDQYFAKALSPPVLPPSAKIAETTASPPTHKISEDGFYGQPCYVSGKLSESKTSTSALRKEKDVEILPVEDKAVVYHPGHYEEEVTGSLARQLREPPVESDDDFVLVHKPKAEATGKIFHPSGEETNILVREEDIEAYPIHRFANVYHSGFSGSKKDRNLKVEHAKRLKRDDAVDKRKVSKRKYPTSEKFEGPVLSMKRSVELPPEPLSTYANVYNQGYYDRIGPKGTDIDDKGDMRTWLRCYQKPVKPEAKLVKEKSTDAKVKEKTEKPEVKLVKEKSPDAKVKEKTEKPKAKLVKEKSPGAKVKEKTKKSAKRSIVGGHAVDISESVDGEKKKAKKTAHIHVRQPGYEEQMVQSSYYSAEVAEPTDRELRQTEYSAKHEPVMVGVKTDESFDDEIMHKMQPKQICRLFVGDSDSYPVRPGAYGVPSTSYDELLHNIKPEEELPLLPINEYVGIYHPGMSDIKSKKHRNLLIWKERQRAARNKITAKEMQTDSEKRRTEVLDEFGVQERGLTKAGSVEEVAIANEMNKKRVMQEMKGKVAVDSEVQKSVKKIKVKKDKKLADEQEIKSESTSQKMKAILYLSEDQYKPENQEKEIVLKEAQKSKETYRIFGIGKLSGKKSKKTGTFEQSHNEHVPDSAPSIRKLSRVKEISFQHLHYAVKNRYQASSFKTFKRAKHRGTEEFVAKENIDPENYKYEKAPYQGPLDFINYTKGLQYAPINEYSAVYHPGNTYVKSRKVIRKDVVKLRDEQKLSTSRSDREAILSRSEDQGTKYAAKIVCKTPIEGRIKTKKHRFRYHKVPGDVEIVEKRFVKPETYNLLTAPYDGPINNLERKKELPFTSLQECATLYHSGVSFKKTKRFHYSSSESSSSTSLSSSSSSIYTIEKRKGPKKSRERDASGVTPDLSKQKGIFSSCCKLVFCENDENIPDHKKGKLKASSQSHLIQEQQPQASSDFSSSQSALSPEQIVPTKDSVEESESGSKKMIGKLPLREESLITSEYGGDSSKRGKRDLFHFWQSAGKESSSKKSSSFTVDKDNSGQGPLIKMGELALTVDMKEEPLMHGSLSATDQSLDVEKKNGFTYLKPDSELPDDIPLNLNGSSGTSRQETTFPIYYPYPSLKSKESSKSGSTGKFQLLKKKSMPIPESNDDSTFEKYDSRDCVGYTARIKVKQEIKSVDEDLQQDPKLKEREKNALDGKRSGFVVKGFHLRGPPCDLGSEVAGDRVTITNGASSASNANNQVMRDEITGLEIRKGIESDVTLKDSKKDSSKSSGGGFFSSLWRGSKPKAIDECPKKQHKLKTSRAQKLKYSLGRGTDSGGRTEQDFVPVYDFSYVPNFSSSDVEVAIGTDEINAKTKERKKSKLRQLFSHRSRNMEEYSDMPVPLDNQDESWGQGPSVDIRKQTSKGKTAAASACKKLDSKMEELEVQRTEAGTFDNEFHRNGISDGDISDEYKFTQTPPDFPVQAAYSTNHKRPSDFVEQIKEQVTQIITKTSPSPDAKKKLKEVKKQTGTNASPDESKSPSVSEFEIVSDHDDFSFNQSKDGSVPYTNVQSWKETIDACRAVVTNVDHQGNIIEKTIEVQQVMHPMEHQVTSSAFSRQDEDSEMNATGEAINPLIPGINGNITSFQMPVVETLDNKLAHEPAHDADETNGNDYSDIPGELVSSRTVTQGNRTIEIITAVFIPRHFQYKTEKDGVVETHVQHRVTIHSCDDIDHDAELDQAILEATNMNPDMTVEKIEVKHES